MYDVLTVVLSIYVTNTSIITTFTKMCLIEFCENFDRIYTFISIISKTQVIIFYRMVLFSLHSMVKIAQWLQLPQILLNSFHR